MTCVLGLSHQFEIFNCVVSPISIHSSAHPNMYQSLPGTRDLQQVRNANKRASRSNRDCRYMPYFPLSDPYFFPCFLGRDHFGVRLISRASIAPEMLLALWVRTDIHHFADITIAVHDNGLLGALAVVLSRDCYVFITRQQLLLFRRPQAVAGFRRDLEHLGALLLELPLLHGNSDAHPLAGNSR